MKKMWRTKEVAEELGVNQKTIQRWIKQHSLDCEISGAGHYEINEDNYKKLHKIAKETGNKRKQPVRHKAETEEVKRVTAAMLDEKFCSLLLQVDQLDKQLQNKADEVVEYQMLQHRKEIDELTNSIDQFNTRLAKIENLLQANAEKIIHLHDKKAEKTPKRNRLAGIFSF